MNKIHVNWQKTLKEMREKRKKWKQTNSKPVGDIKIWYNIEMVCGVFNSLGFVSIPRLNH